MGNELDNGFFATAKRNATVLLEWLTSSESNNKGFIIERSLFNNNSSLLDFEEIGFVKGNGTTASPKKYEFTDAPLGGKKFIYRLKQVNFDGAYKYSDQRIVSLTGFDYALHDIFPNPVTDKAMIQYQLPEAGQVNISVYSMDGKLLKTLVNEWAQPGIYKVSLNTNTFSAGSYVFKMTSTGFYNTKTFVVTK